MAINIFCCTQIVNLIEFSIQIQFGAFLRGHFGTPMDPAPVLLSGILCSTSHYVRAGGKPSTWFPPGDLQSKATLRRRIPAADWLLLQPGCRLS